MAELSVNIFFKRSAFVTLLILFDRCRVTKILSSCDAFLIICEDPQLTVDLRKFQEWAIRVDKPYTQTGELIYGF